MGQDLMNVEAFRGKAPSKLFQEALNPHSESLADGIGSSYGVIGYKGKVWSLRYKGDKHTFVRPDDGTPVGYIDVVVLQQAKVKSKSYYKDYDPSGTSEGSRPICASLDGVIPDADVQEKQADTCALCPRNVWHTEVNGKKGRDCSDYKRLAVLLMPNQTKHLLGAPLMEPVFLRVPAGSLNNLSLMGEQMASQGWHFSSFITRVSFDPNEAHPKMVFRALQGLADNEAPVVLPLRLDPQAIRIIGEDQPKRLAPPSGGSASGGSAQPLQQQTVTKPSQQPAQQSVQSTPQRTAAAPKQEATAASIAESHIDTGFGTVMTASHSDVKVVDTTPEQTADTGEATDSDAALDARIAGLMPKA